MPRFIRPHCFLALSLVLALPAVAHADEPDRPRPNAIVPSFRGYPSHPMPVAAPSTEVPGVVRLHIDTPVPVRVVTDAKDPVDLCASPCDTVVDGSHGESFRVVANDGKAHTDGALGDDVPRADPFKIGVLRGDVDLRVEPGNGSAHTTGGVLATIGALGGIAGLGVLLGGAIVAAGAGKSNGAEPGGAIAAGAGALIFLTGGLLLSQSESKVDLHPRRSGAIKPKYWLGQF